ncbi:tRNA pseudouridine(38-40) synthase TruA [Aggregatilinea lenta]|uniref:tRNA pseudouridine(38-40) synthase TruA n=1 Tax=Aggregatilinea lenta TaxID=913108 RepID=UPI001EE79FD6|nr:tRNA pseudouridine(38-40) synthase TruA [Aggregatilinea lenta]
MEGLRYRAVVAYDGTDYFGFQRQANAPTIQGTIEAALLRVTRQPVTILGAGRTDAGVHATGQVVAFDVAWKHSPHELERALNATLPNAIAIRSLEVAEPGFHPRFDARSRCYEYTLYAAPVRQPLRERYAWHLRARDALDLEAMQRAASSLIGVHDFATFGRPPQGESTIREVLRSELTLVALADPETQIIRYTIEANAFLYRMVRRIVGALSRVGGEKLSPEAFEAALHAADETCLHHMASASGLCLARVSY